METTYAKHLQWCKDRALAYVDAGDLDQAYASMARDLGNHPMTAGNPAIQLGMMMLIGGHLNTAEKMRSFINGFN